MRTLLLALALAPLAGCGALFVGGAAALVAQNELDNSTYRARVEVDAQIVWIEVKRALSDSSEKVVETDEETMVAKANVDGSLVTVAVTRFDERSTEIRTHARTVMVSNGELARLIHERILLRLENQPNP